MDVQLSDFATIGVLVVLEGLLSADNALVLAVMILGLPRLDQKKALRYGLVGAFAFRTLATALATHLIRVGWVKVLGGGYLIYLTFQHFLQGGSAEDRSRPKPALPWLGLSALWGTVVKVELVNVAFSVDSILVAVAMSRKFWVVLTGGLLGIVAIRVVIGQLLTLVRRYPTHRRRRVRDHRVGRDQAADRVPERRRLRALRDRQVAVVAADRRHLHRGLPARPAQGPGGRRRPGGRRSLCPA